MLNPFQNRYNITKEEVSPNNRFCFSAFKALVIERSPVGTMIDPRSLVRLAASLGAKGKDHDEIRKQLIFSFNSSGAQIKRRRGDSGYVYEKLA